MFSVEILSIGIARGVVVDTVAELITKGWWTGMIMVVAISLVRETSVKGEPLIEVGIAVPAFASIWNVATGTNAVRESIAGIEHGDPVYKIADRATASDSLRSYG